ncbi:DUF1707 SHOCT-like domain-containing protein, partial [Mycobacteroides abscessus]|uniref:DUF1707 SHOCT-like domain-containing protein n=1 Tax=Mycobacteroides abscessus TaxID=36809 RepID=UPI001F2AB7EB
MSNLPERVTASMRAADVDRMRVAQLLSDAAAQGRLELSEFEQRLAKVYSANTYGELDQLSADLPDVATSPVRGQGSKPAPSTVLMAIMSGFERSNCQYLWIGVFQATSVPVGVAGLSA